jgi:hypothetical protein
MIGAVIKVRRVVGPAAEMGRNTESRRRAAAGWPLGRMCVNRNLPDALPFGNDVLKSEFIFFESERPPNRRSSLIAGHHYEHN